MSKYIRVKNEMPELLHVLCNHPDCPEWLAGVIWDVMNERADREAYSLDYLKFLYETSKDNGNCEVCDRPVRSYVYTHENCNQTGIQEQGFQPLRLVKGTDTIQ